MVAKLFFRILLASLPVLVVMALINYAVDPAFVIRDSTYEKQVAQGIIEGKIVLVNPNYNERKLQRELISGFATSRDGIVVGSSRVLNIPCASLGFQDGFCNGVSGATMEDMIGIIGMYEQRNILPSSVVIGIDPWLFNANFAGDKYKELIPEYNDFADKLGLKKFSSVVRYSNNGLVKVEQLFSPTYFRASLKGIGMPPTRIFSILKNINNDRPSPIISNDISPEYTNKLPDGSLIYIEKYNMRTEDEINQSVISTINMGGIYYLKDYKELSPKIINQFTSLVNWLKSENVTVIFVIPPLHQMIYAYTIEIEDCKMLIETESFVRTFAEESGIHVIGSFNPENVGAVNTDFHDSFHPTREFMIKLCSG